MAVERFESDRIERYFKGEFSEEDKSYVEELFSDNRNDAELKSLLSRQFHDLKKDDEERKNLDQILYRINYDINTGSVEKRPELFSKCNKMGSPDCRDHTFTSCAYLYWVKRL